MHDSVYAPGILSYECLPNYRNLNTDAPTVTSHASTDSYQNGVSYLTGSKRSGMGILNRCQPTAFGGYCIGIPFITSYMLPRFTIRLSRFSWRYSWACGSVLINCMAICTGAQMYCTNIYLYAHTQDSQNAPFWL